MDTEGEQLLVLARSQKAKALEIIIDKVLGHPSIYKFAEFLDIENVQNLGEDNKHLRTLKIFAYSDYKEYKANKDSYLKLNDKQLKKLKMLSIITMAGKSTSLTYDYLCSELDIADKQDLDEILLDLIYNKLINATLDEKDRVVRVEWTFGRDAKAEDIDNMLSKLEGWVKTMERVEKSIENTIEDLDKSLADSKDEKAAFLQQFFETHEEEKKQTKDKFGQITSILTKLPSKVLGK